jgi:hypothetical protein
MPDSVITTSTRGRPAARAGSTAPRRGAPRCRSADHAHQRHHLRQRRRPRSSCCRCPRAPRRPSPGTHCPSQLVLGEQQLGARAPFEHRRRTRHAVRIEAVDVAPRGQHRRHAQQIAARCRWHVACVERAQHAGNLVVLRAAAARACMRLRAAPPPAHPAGADAAPVRSAAAGAQRLARALQAMHQSFHDGSNAAPAVMAVRRCSEVASPAIALIDRRQLQLRRPLRAISMSTSTRASGGMPSPTTCRPAESATVLELEQPLAQLRHDRVGLLRTPRRLGDGELHRGGLLLHERTQRRGLFGLRLVELTPAIERGLEVEQARDTGRRCVIGGVRYDTSVALPRRLASVPSDELLDAYRYTFGRSPMRRSGQQRSSRPACLPGMNSSAPCVPKCSTASAL